MRASLAALATTALSLLACSGNVQTTPITPTDPAPAPVTATPSASLSGAGTSASPHVADCFTTANAIGKKANDVDYVQCPAGCTTAAVWGTGRYTPDSSVCTAAVHSGALPGAGGGVVLVSLQGSFANFMGSTQNGVTSQSWTAAYDPTFSVTASGAPAPVPATPEREGKAGKRGDGEGKAGKGGKNR